MGEDRPILLIGSPEPEFCPLSPTVPTGIEKEGEWERSGDSEALPSPDQTQPVGFGSPATLQAPFAGPLGKRS